MIKYNASAVGTADRKKRWMAAVLAAAMLFLSACSPPGSGREETDTLTFFALDTVVSLTCCGKDREQALSEVQDSIVQMEGEWSRTQPGSLLWQLNHAGGEPVTVPPSMACILEEAEKLTGLTAGAFDITIAPAADLWGFTREAFRIPPAEEIEAVRSKVGMEHVHLQGTSVQMDEGTELDLGGIAKGYALEQARDSFRKHALTGGIADLGGDALAYGVKPNGEPWRIAIRDPEYHENEEGILGTLSMTDCYFLTSGGYERYFEADGKRYPHILDPKTCAPAESRLESVTVITSLEDDFGMMADALATALFIMGPDEAVEFWRDSGLDFDMILVDDSGHVSLTERLRDTFVPKASDRYEYRFLS